MSEFNARGYSYNKASVFCDLLDWKRLLDGECAHPLKYKLDLYSKENPQIQNN